jgi:hypothetical protein
MKFPLFTILLSALAEAFVESEPILGDGTRIKKMIVNVNMGNGPHEKVSLRRLGLRNATKKVVKHDAPSPPSSSKVKGLSALSSSSLSSTSSSSSIEPVSHGNARTARRNKGPKTVPADVKETAGVARLKTVCNMFKDKMLQAYNQYNRDLDEAFSQAKRELKGLLANPPAATSKDEKGNKEGAKENCSNTKAQRSGENKKGQLKHKNSGKGKDKPKAKPIESLSS